MLFFFFICFTLSFFFFTKPCFFHFLFSDSSSIGIEQFLSVFMSLGLLNLDSIHFLHVLSLSASGRQPWKGLGPVVRELGEMMKIGWLGYGLCQPFHTEGSQKFSLSLWFCFAF